MIGGGLIAQLVHLPLLRADGGRFAVAALADPSERVRRALADRHGIAATYGDYRALLEQPLDAVVVCAPNGLHAEIVLAALDAGTNVLVEKPLCLTEADAERIVERQRDTGLVVQVGYMKRFSPAYEAMAVDVALADPGVRLVSSVTVDPVLARHFTPRDFVAADDIPASARTAAAIATAAQVAEATRSDDPSHVEPYSAAFLGALIHDVNAVHGVLGAGAFGVLDAFLDPAGRTAGGTVALPGGGRWSMAWLLLAGAGPFSEEIRVLADEGEWRLRLPAPYLRQAPATYRCERRSERGGWHSRSEASYADPYARQLEHFHACVTAAEPCRTPASQAREDVALLARLFRAGLEAGADRMSTPRVDT
ncbi:MAG: Gfo/Idh/MocA family protein [Solirubrobacteraceae bacterium]